MPEIKHNFTGGKMNKDLDERLIPNGQYRDAMNIQVSTSEGSDVGTIQNILGNSIVPGQDFISENAVCVGSIADEKNDKLYWFVINYDEEEYITNGKFTGGSSGWGAGQVLMGGTGTIVPLPSQGWSYSNDSVTATDVEQYISLVQRDVHIEAGKMYVIKCDITNFSGTGDLTPVLVDQAGYWVRPGGSTYVNGVNQDYQQYAVDGDGTYTWTLRANVGWDEGQELPYTPTGWVPYLPNQVYFQNRADTSGGSNKLNCTIDNISVKGVSSSCIVQYDTKRNKVVPVFVDTDNTALRLSPGKLITGINIIDDLLFWTDNNSEPKKINIERSIQGTRTRGFTNTMIINPAQGHTTNWEGVSVREEHLAVARKPPKNPPIIEYIVARDLDKDYTGIVKISDHLANPNSFINSSIGRVHDFSFLTVGDTFSTVIESTIDNRNEFSLDWKVGDRVVLKEFDSDNEPPITPIANYRIKGTIKDWVGNRFTNTNFLLTNNGDMSEGSGSTPNYWGLHSGWTWNQALKYIECDGASSTDHHKIWNNQPERDIVEGGNYKIKYTIGPPTDGSPMTGACTVRLVGSDPNSAPTGSIAPGDGFFWNLGSHSQPGAFEHEIWFDHLDHGTTSMPSGKGEWPWGNGAGSYLNSILFEAITSGTVSLGPNLANVGLVTASVTTGTTIGSGMPTFVLHASGSYVAVPTTWTVQTLNQVTFNHQYIDDAAFAPLYSTTTYLNNIQDTNLISGEEYDITVTVSNMTNNGTSSSTTLGVSSNGGVGNLVRITSSTGHAHSGAQATAGDPWTGFGGRRTHTFTATSGARIDLFAYKSGGISSTDGPSGDITVTLKHRANYPFKGTVSNVSIQELDETQAMVEIEIDSIDGTPPNTDENEISRNYAIDLLDEEEKLFEFKFPRFAYRYKYEDGEYSTISPFSEVAFVPGRFDYHPKKGYNLGMVNNIKGLRIRGYNKNLPQDVTGIDILYKEEHSPNIYVVDDIKDINAQYSSYLIEHETIKNGLLTSNQLLRPWDNVPRKALAQEIVGNRIVYGNYLQNYNLISSRNNSLDYNINMSVDAISKKNDSRSGERSIKSLRDYQVGVVFSDEYGRETPILTSTKATASVNKSSASEINQLQVNIHTHYTGHPVNMKYFKFFVKDIGGEYYNLAMDRFYDAEDDNIWLAFPSTDRNKVDIDDFLILKKGAGDVVKDLSTGELKNVIKEKAQYKILDIKNEAPDFIKRKETRIAFIRHLDSSKLFKDNNLPVVGDTDFSIEHNRIANASYARLHENFGQNPDVEYHISLSNTDTNRVSDRYKIIELYGDDSGGTPTWYFTLEKPFNSEANEFSNDPTGINTTAIKDNTYLNIYRTAPDKSASHKFDGRFFVKIYNDDIFSRSLKEVVDDTKKEYKTTGQERKIYSLKTTPGTNRIEPFWKTTALLGTATQAFNGIKDRVDSVGLHPNVTNKPTNPAVTWAWYDYVTRTFGQHLGTFSDRVTLEYLGHSNSHYDVWKDYDAYFRGINVNIQNNAIKDRVDMGALDIHDKNSSDQRFQDVWFIDEAESVGNFPYSNVSGKSTGWKTFPTRSSWKSLGLYSAGSGSSSRSTIELSFGGIQPVKWFVSDNGWGTDEEFFDLAEQNINYSKKEGDFIKNIAIGGQFRFKEDPDHTVYTITGVDIILRCRYESLRSYGIENWENDTGFWNDKPHEWQDKFVKDLGTATAKSKLGPNDLYPIHQRANAGISTGLRTADETTIYHNIGGYTQGVDNLDKVIVSGHNLETGIAPAQDLDPDNFIVRTCTFLRPSNYTKNWRIRVTPAFRDNWNPLEDTGGSQISDQTPIKLTATGSGHNYATTNAITGTGTTVAGDNINRLSIGMVLKSYLDNNVSSNEITLSPPAIVSDITEPSTGVFKIWFKTYDGSRDFTGGTAGGTMPGGIENADVLNFYQFPMNGLSPNAAKNLNYFRDGIGFAADGTTGEAGTDAIGYTWEFVEEKSSRSEEEILPANPAIWETKAKDNKDLDIYHEATGSIPIYEELTRDNMLELIPIGSTIEHDGSNAIPIGTTVYDINPDTEEIILSSNIKIQEDTSSQTFIAWLQSFGYTPGTVPFVSTGGGKIICTELCEQGYLPKEVLELDYQHSDNNMDMATKIGYWKWSIPVVEAMRKSKVITQIIRPFGVAWAHEMAHREEPQNYSGNILGKLIMVIGVPICRYIGKREIIKNNIKT